MQGLRSQNMKLASSELQQRLEHLITYSTQLIFVSGEGVGRQFKLAEDFIGEQSDHSNVIYLPAREHFDINDYRRNVLQQLSPHSGEDDSRPLSETFSRAVSEQQAPILLCISSAEHLSREFLQELWDLVLQNRFARHRYHLNVLLFAEESWATKAKSWLPSRHQEQPVLVNAGQTDIENSASQGTELEQLIADKRQQFAQRIENRTQKTYVEPKAVIKTWWMKLLLVCVFVLSFGSLVLWQHYDVTKEAVAEFAEFIFQTDLPEQVAGEALLELQEDALLPTREATQENEQSVSITGSVAEVSEDKMETVAGKAMSRLDADNDRLGLVTDWKSAIDSLDDKLVTVGQQDQGKRNPEKRGEEQDPVPSSSLPESNATESTHISAVETSEVQEYDITQISTTDDVLDYQVEDIIEAPVSTPAQEQSPESGYQYQEDKLLALPDNSFLLQLSAMSSLDVLNQFLRQHNLQETAQVYVTQRYGGDWHVVLFKDSFSSIEQARQAVADLSPALQNIQPFAKSVSAVKKEIAANSVDN